MTQYRHQIRRGQTLRSGRLHHGRHTITVAEGDKRSEIGCRVERIAEDDLGKDVRDTGHELVEDRFVDVVITDEDVDQIDVVGDLIRHLKSARVAKGDDATVEAPLQ